MPNWTEIQEHMRQTYKLSEDQSDMAAMVWSYDDGRSQKIIVRRYNAFGREMVEFKSAFANKHDTDAISMLRKNSELPLAMIALADDTYIVVYNTPIENLEFTDLDFYLSRVAAVADTLEETYGKRDVF
jgi:hypothetical protein